MLQKHRDYKKEFTLPSAEDRQEHRHAEANAHLIQLLRRKVDLIAKLNQEFLSCKGHTICYI